MLMRQRAWGSVSEVRVYWDIQNVGGEVMEGESARMIRNLAFQGPGMWEPEVGSSKIDGCESWN